MIVLTGSSKLPKINACTDTDPFAVRGVVDEPETNLKKTIYQKTYRFRAARRRILLETPGIRGQTPGPPAEKR